MQYFKEIVRKNRKLIIVYIVLGISLAFLENYSAQYFETLIDGFNDRTLSLGRILIYGGILILICILNYLDEYPNCKLEKKLYIDFKLMALRKISRIDYECYEELGTGMLIQKIENGASAGTQILFNFVFALIRNLGPSILFSLFFIGRISKPIIIGIMGGYMVVFIITHYLLKYLYHIKERILVNEEKLNKLLVRGFMELSVFRLNGRFKAEIEKASVAGHTIINNKVKMKLVHEAFFASFALLVTVIKIVIIYYGWKIQTLTIGAVVALITLIDHAYTPIAIFNVLYVQFKLDQAAFNRYEQFLEMKNDKGLESGVPLSELKGELEMQNLTFKYKGKVIFEKLDMIVHKGESIALVGESGSGKSTLVKLIAGLLKPISGEILVDGKSLTKISLQSYYKQIAYVSQEAPIFDGTLRENLVFDQNVSDDRLIEALKRVELSQLVSKLDKGLDTPIGEKGITLSGGERQRLALARLYFSQANLIILDEATSAMDNLTEAAVMANVLEQCKGKTLIIIAHRLSSIKTVNRLMIFKEGHIVGEGTFDELAKTNDYFKRLISKEIQIGEKVVEI